MSRNEEDTCEDVTLGEALEKFQAQEGLHNYEGRRGLVALAKIARAIGYKDPQHFGQIGKNAYIGDLIEFLEDNSGAVETIIEWIVNEDNNDWKESVLEQLDSEEDEEDA